MNIDNYYICHYSKLVERKKYIEDHVSQYNLNLEWVLDFDKEDIDYDSLTDKYPLILSPIQQFGRKITKPEISLCLKHIITHSGNCGIWSVFYRGNTDNVHQYLDHKANYIDFKGWYEF